MSMIRIENLTYYYPSSFDPVFENANFQIDTEWNLGFVGRNGRGKTTLLKILLGEYEYSGRIISSVLFDYFPFPVSDKTQMTRYFASSMSECPAMGINKRAVLPWNRV